MACRALPAPLAAAAMELEVPEEAEGSAVAGAGAITPEAGAGEPDAAGGNVVTSPRGAPPGCVPPSPPSSVSWFLSAPPSGFGVGRSRCPPPSPNGSALWGMWVGAPYPHTRTEPVVLRLRAGGARGGPRRPELHLSAALWFVRGLKTGFGCAGPGGCPLPELLRGTERCGLRSVGHPVPCSAHTKTWQRVRAYFMDVIAWMWGSPQLPAQPSGSAAGFVGLTALSCAAGERGREGTRVPVLGPGTLL